MPNPVVHFEVSAKDAKQSQEFYAKLFDWHIDDNNPMNYGMVDTHTEGVGINGGIAGQDPQGPPHPGVTFYVQVDDLQKALDKAESLGGKTVMPPMEIPDTVALAMFSDPSGNIIGLVRGE